MKTYQTPASVPAIEYIERDLVLGGNTTFDSVAAHSGVMCITLHAQQRPSGTMTVLIRVNSVDRVQYNVVNPVSGHLIDTSTIHVDKGDTVSVVVTVSALGFGYLYYRTYFWYL
jgi:hypothetical protein